MTNSIEFKNFTKKYKGRSEPAVKDLTFSVEKGSFHGLIGANGSGKTTTIKSLIRAFVNYEGEILIGGISNSKREARDMVGYIPENASFPSGLSAKSYLFHMARLSGVPMKEAKESASKMLKKFGMEKMAKKNPSSFSSGQKKKLLLAQALIHNPKVLVMDEPAANLDPIARKDFFDTLLNLNNDGITIFITSHILAELDNYIKSATILDNGAVAFSGKLNDMKKTSNMILEFSTKEQADQIVESFKTQFNISRKGKETLVISLNQKDGSILSEQDVISPIVKKTIPNSYFVERISLQDIYSKFAVVGSVDTKEVQKKRWWNVKLR